jgi:branched-chain amino acid transport system ATP-binding protein
MSEAPMLQVEDVAHAFGGVQAVAGASLSVGAGKFIGLIGPNGSSKSTLLDCISGNINDFSGRVRFDGDVQPHGRPGGAEGRGFAPRGLRRLAQAGQ